MLTLRTFFALGRVRFADVFVVPSCGAIFTRCWGILSCFTRPIFSCFTIFAQTLFAQSRLIAVTTFWTIFTLLQSLVVGKSTLDAFPAALVLRHSTFDGTEFSTLAAIAVVCFILIIRKVTLRARETWIRILLRAVRTKTTNCTVKSGGVYDFFNCPRWTSFATGCPRCFRTFTRNTSGGTRRST